MDHYSSQQLVDALHNLYRKAGLSEENKTPRQLETLRAEALKLVNLHQNGHNHHEQREVTILLSDLRGFTALSERYSPLEIIDLLNRYFTAMTEVIAHYGGTIDKFMGDAMMVVFGSPKQHVDDLNRALSCAVAMQIALDTLNRDNALLGYPPLYMGIGMNTGEVVAGNLGSDIYSEYTVIGDHVNLASRVESYSLRGQILLSEHTYRRAQHLVETGQRNVLTAKGKEKPINTYELLAVTHPETLRVPVREDRKSPRVAVNMPLSFQQVQGKYVNHDYNEGDIIDLSYGGMYVATDCQLAPSSEIRFPLALSLSSHQKHDVYAKVLRTNPMQNDRFHYHLEFSSISMQAQAALKDFVDRLITT